MLMEAMTMTMMMREMIDDDMWEHCTITNQL